MTEQTGKRKTVKFRKACDRDFRDIAQLWAIPSVSQSVWTAGYLSRVRPRPHSDNHAYRRLANRWDLPSCGSCDKRAKRMTKNTTCRQCAKRRKPRN